MIKRLLYNWLKADFAKWNEARKPLALSSLELAYTDLNGVNYYRCPDTMQLPLERWSKAKDYMMFMASGISDVELTMLIDFADKALTEGITGKGKGAAKIGFALQELRERKNIIIHSELVYNYLAVHWIREDERPEVVDMAIHQQKVDQFKLEVEKGDSYFFFQERELKKIYDPFNLSRAELTALLQEGIVKQEALKKMLASLA